MSILTRFENYMCGILPTYNPYKITNKSQVITQHITYMLNRTQSMFAWHGLPETIPARILELYLQINGNVCFYQYDGNLYVFCGGMGGEPDVYYMPTIYTIANPALKISKELAIDIECVVMANDSMYAGLMPLYEKYATAMTETEISIDVATVNSRIYTLITAPDDRTFESAKKYLDDVRDGKQGVIADNVFLDGIRTQPYGATSNSNTITNLIELNQYQKASWYNEIGLNANYNMKREAINSDESQLNSDALLPLIDNMLEMRKIGCEKVNRMYDTSISVELSSSWEDNAQELEKELEEIDPADTDNADNQGGKDGGGNEGSDTPD